MDGALATDAGIFMSQNIWLVYLCLVVAPFVQEDAAVIAAASLSLAGMGNTVSIFVLTVIALSASDYWKYWAGRLAHKSKWACRLASRPSVARAEGIIKGNLGKSLMIARFVPGTRIPLYVASGYFGAKWRVFARWVFLSALVYVSIAFVLFHAIGAVVGEALRAWLPVGAIALLVFLLGLNALRRKMSGISDQ